MMGVAGILGGALLSAIHGVTVRTLCIKMANKQILSRHLTQLQEEETYSMVQRTVLVSDLWYCV